VNSDSSSRLTFAIQLAQDAGQLLREYFTREEIGSTLKGDFSIVTQADLAADRLITSRLKERYPDDLLISEESQTAFPASGVRAGQAVWIIDPLDGTTNFSLGLQIWGVLIACIVDGWPEIAVLYFPLLNELYSAQNGHGAFLNDKRLQKNTEKDRRPLSFFACCSRTFRNYQVSIPYKVRILGSAAYTFSCVARNIAVVGFEATTKIWDIAGAWLLVKESGSVIETLDGSQPFPLRPQVDYSRISFPTLAAESAEIYARAHHQILPRVTF
jgi:myo-inositol-1(or 4)-monophosphatase